MTHVFSTERGMSCSLAHSETIFISAWTSLLYSFTLPTNLMSSNKATAGSRKHRIREYVRMLYIIDPQNRTLDHTRCHLKNSGISKTNFYMLCSTSQKAGKRLKCCLDYFHVSNSLNDEVLYQIPSVSRKI